jgi:amidase
VAALIALTAIVGTTTRAARTFDLSTASIADINAAVDARALTSERLTRLYLARIAAYDTAGPRLNSVFHLNPRALDDARALDTERRVSGRRTPLHGIPVRPPVDYTASLDRATLKGARLGLARDFMGTDEAWDGVIESAVAAIRAQGAEVVDVTLPRYVLALISGVYPTIRDTEFRYQIEAYLASLSLAGVPRTHADIIRLSEMIAAPTREGWVPNPGRLAAYRREAAMGPLDDQPYRSALGEGRKIIRDLLEWTLKQQRLDALIGPTIRPARLISEEAIPESRGWRDLGSLAGWPEVVVPAGDTTEPKLPVGISFLGPAFSESRLLALGHAFERGYPMRRPPPTTPPLQGERFEY